MNPLEEEYDDSVRRAALASERFEARASYVGVVLVCGGYGGVAALGAGDLRLGLFALGATALFAIAIYLALPFGMRVLARLRDRETESLSTPRERSSPRVTRHVARRPSWRAKLASAFVPAGLLAWFVVCDALLPRDRDGELRARGFVLAATAVAYVATRIYEAWRKRRSARLESRLEPNDT